MRKGQKATPEQTARRIENLRLARLARAAKKAEHEAAFEGEAAQPASPAAAVPQAAPFALDPALAAEFTEAELQAMWQEARMQVLAEQKAARKKALKERMVIAARADAGVLSADDKRREEQIRLSEMTRVSINLPEFAPAVRLDGRQYRHGTSHEVTRAVYETLVDEMAKAWNHQAEVMGLRKNYFSEQHGWMQHNGRPAGSVARRV